MASKRGPPAAQVLLVGTQSLPLPVLLQEQEQEQEQADLLQQALQGAAALGDTESSGEVNLDDISSSNNDLVAIYQGEEGNTHTIKISLAEAESLGLHFSNDNFPTSLENNAIDETLKISSDHNPLTSNDLNDNQAVSVNNFLQTMSCANISSEGRLMDVEGNLIEASEELQVLPSSLSTLLDGGLNQSITIIPQYGLDGSITYAVKLKDQDGNILGPDYHIMEPDSSAKTGLEIEEEITHPDLKQGVLQSSDTVSLPSSIALSHESEPSSSVSTLGSLSNHMLLPLSNSTVPIPVETPVTLSIPAENTIGSSSSSVMSVSQSSPNSSRFFRIVPDRSVSISNLIPSASIVSQPTISLTGQSSPGLGQPQVSQIGSGKLATLNGSSVVNIEATDSKVKPRLAIPGGRLSSLLSTPPPYPTCSVKKMPVSIATPATAVVSSAPAPAMAAVAPNTTQPTIGGASTSKSSSFSSRLTSSSTNSSKPLGSSENPIQLVQQGQTFHSMQALSQAQLRQIATVLQQKHLNSNSSSAKNVLFDEQTKTRIVYRVVYPEDVDLQQPTSPNDKNVNAVAESIRNVNKGKKRRGRRKEASEKVSHRNGSLGNKNSHLSDMKKNQGDDDQTPEIVIKAERKKILGSRTRSGRVSRPPKHMMKDYKRLHHLDYQEPDADDSDGGYSDYINSAEPLPEVPSEKEPEPEPEVDPSVIGTTTGKKKMSRFHCPTCHKLYLGHGRMEKHFNRFPDHGSIEEFKQSLSVATPPNTTEDMLSDKKAHVTKYNGARGKKRGQWARTEKERSDCRKKKLKQALKACDISEVVEVAGPLIAQYYTLWELLLLRLCARDEGKVSMETSQQDRAKLNRVQWLLMELSSLADTLQSVARDLFRPAHVHESDNDRLEINEKKISEILGVSCGTYTVNEQPLLKYIEDLTSGKLESSEEDLMACVAKRMRMKDEHIGSTSNTDCSEVIPSLTLLTKTPMGNDTDKAILEKFTEDIPFLNSSDDMICDGVKQDQDCDPAAGLQVVDDIVNERLKKLSENMNFTVELQSDLGSSDLNNEQSDLHLITGFDSSESSMSVGNQSVISRSSKTPVSVSNMDLISTYSLPPDPVPVTSQGMLGGFSLGLGPYEALPPQSSPITNVSHSADSFLDSLSSFETPLTQSCSSSAAAVSSFSDSVMKNNSILELNSDTQEEVRPPPKFISSFTPAITNDKQSVPITTAQRLQRSYLALDSGLDVGLDTDLDFEAFTEEFNRNTPNETI